AHDGGGCDRARAVLRERPVRIRLVRSALGPGRAPAAGRAFVLHRVREAPVGAVDAAELRRGRRRGVPGLAAALERGGRVTAASGSGRGRARGRERRLQLIACSCRWRSSTTFWIHWM